jgi:type III restriction enzyme
VLGAPVIPPREGQRAALQPIIDAFMDGLKAKAGDQAEQILSAYLDRAAYRLIELITLEQRRIVAKPQIDQVTELELFGPTRQGRPETSHDLKGAFKKGVGYEGWTHSMYDQVWFDSSTERDVANLLDEASDMLRRMTLSVSDDWRITRKIGIGSCSVSTPAAFSRREVSVPFHVPLRYG